MMPEPELWTRCPNAVVKTKPRRVGGWWWECKCHPGEWGRRKVPFDEAVERMVESDVTEVTRLRQEIGASVMTDPAEIEEWKTLTREWMGRRLLAALGEDTT